MTPISLLIAEQAGSKRAIKLIVARLGVVGCIRVLSGVVADQIRGEPWRALGKPADRKESLSRRQIGSAVILERRLRSVLPKDEARAIVEDIVRLASIEFLKRNVPVLRRDELLRMPDGQREVFLRGIQDKFFNADADITLRGDEALDLSIRRCRFVELLDAIGERDMAAVFCEGDRFFFEQHQPEVILDRPEKLSTGGSFCDFRFRWK